MKILDNLENFGKFSKFDKFDKFSKILQIFQNFPNFPKVSKFSKIIKIFQIFQIFKFPNFQISKLQKVFWNPRCYQHLWCLYYIYFPLEAKFAFLLFDIDTKVVLGCTSCFLMCAEIMKSVDVSFKGLSFDLIFVAIMLTLLGGGPFQLFNFVRYFHIVLHGS